MPGILDRAQPLLNLDIARRRKRTGRVALAQVVQHRIETLEGLVQAAGDFVGIAPGIERQLHLVRHPVTAHALAASIIDRRRHPLKLPREVKRHADRRQGDQGKNQKHSDDLARKLAR